MRLAVTVLALLLIYSAATVAQTTQTDEQQIRALIAKYDAGQSQGMGTKDRIFWSGALKRPTVGSEKGEEVPSDRRLSERVPGSQRNKTTVVRIEVAKSGDLTYEFSNSEVSFDLKSSKRESLQNSTLRVWKKEAGEWKIAAQFSRPHYQEPAAPTK